MKNWYDFLTVEFKLHKDAYIVNDRAAVTCPKCNKVDMVRINHLKAKIKSLGTYECSKCRKQASISRARAYFKEKHSGLNPFQLESSKKKIKETLLKNHGVDCILKLKEVHSKGIKSAASKESRTKAKDTQLKNHGAFNLDVYRAQINISLKENYTKLRNQWKKDGGKPCGHCKKFKQLDQYASLKYPCAKCKTCTNLYNNEYSQIRKALNGSFDISNSNLGCTIEEFTDHIESQFEEGMTWSNWSRTGWHLDHIVPNIKVTIENSHVINNYRNFRPMWASKNKSKNDRLPELIILTGAFGVGKSYVSSLVSDSFTILNKDLGHDLYDIAKSDLTKAVVYQTSMNVVSDIKLMSQFFKLKVVVIQEPIDVIKSRIEGRCGTFNRKSIEFRIKRMSHISKKYGSFSGSASECLDFLKNIKLR